MSSLLQEAIVDAQALKEAAEKQAESYVKEKYADELKEVYDSMLEAEGDSMLGLDPDDEAEGGAAEEPEDFDLEDFEDDLELDPDADFAKQVPHAYQDGEDLCPCPDKDEEIELDFDDLAASMFDGEEMDRGEVANDIMGSDKDMFQESHGRDEDDDDMLGTPPGHPPDEMPPKDDPVWKDSPNHPDNKKKEDDKGMDEGVVSDMNGDKSGWTARPTDELEYELDKFVSNKLNDKHPEEKFKDKDYKKDLEDKETEYDSLEEEYNKVVKELKRYKQAFTKLKEESNQKITKINELNKQALKTIKTVNAERAQYLYQNRVLRDTSLNGRQKNKIVEAISNADSVKDAKVIYETLTKAIDSGANNSTHETNLQEMISQRDFALHTRSKRKRMDESQKEDPAIKRMQKLAGIKE